MGIVSLKDYRWDGSKKLELKDAETGAPEFVDKKTLKAQTMENLAEAAALQDKLYAQGREGILIAIQARDAAGKDSLIKKVFGQLNPAALEVAAFKAPSKEELSHDYLWRIIRTVPPRRENRRDEPQPLRGCACDARAPHGEGLCHAAARDG